MSSLGMYSEYKETNIKINTRDWHYAYMQQHSNITGRKKGEKKMYTHKSNSVS